ncbi:hypothetical protein [Kitasatospora sp. NPDC004289]
MTAAIGVMASPTLLDYALRVWRTYPQPFAGTAGDEIDADQESFLARLNASCLPPSARNDRSGHRQRSCGGGSGVSWPRHRDCQVAGLLQHRLRRGTEPASLRLLASALTRVGPAQPLDPQIRWVLSRYDPLTVAQVGRWLLCNGADEHVVQAGLVLLVETATEQDLPLLRTLGVLTSFAIPTSLALERIPGRGSGPDRARRAHQHLYAWPGRLRRGADPSGRAPGPLPVVGEPDQPLRCAPPGGPLSAGRSRGHALVAPQGR